MGNEGLLRRASGRINRELGGRENGGEEYEERKTRSVRRPDKRMRNDLRDTSGTVLKNGTKM